MEVASPILKNEIIHTFQHFDVPLYSDDTGNKPATVSTITIKILIHTNPLYYCSQTITKSSNIPTFQTINIIAVQWICIDNTNTSTTIWYERIFPNKTTFFTYNIFTYKPYLNFFHKCNTTNFR